ncbi:30S ribosomal protein S19e [Candidatus Woesearchaeota archaeon]|nr:MAG: 30S ribosomal protein S19e [Candidatus Woesearchaeota archaeon]
MIGKTKSSELIQKAAIELKKTIKKPEWASFVKTGTSRERPPVDEDWWYMRAASILRRIYIKGPIGVSKLKTLYGGKKNRGYKPEKFFTGSGKIIRVILQQLEKAELIKQGSKGVHKGRMVTPKGKKFLDALVKNG